MITGTSHIALGEGAEFDTIRDLLHVWGPAAVGIGDDAAVIDIPEGELLVASTDASVENVHFRRGWLTAEEIGARAAAAALSDIAAMAAQPRGLLLALGVPVSWRGDLTGIGRGIARIAKSVDCPIVGGNITSATELTLTITVLGSAAAPLTRSRAREGDIIFVTGTLGAAGAALRALLDGGSPTEEMRQKFASPLPRIAEARWLAGQGAHAAIDISDGLRGDATHLARASSISIVIDGSSLPLVAGVSADEAIASGEEYELMVAFPSDRVPDRGEFMHRFGIPLSRIGVAVAVREHPVEITGVRERDVAGFDHLS